MTRKASIVALIFVVLSVIAGLTYIILSNIAPRTPELPVTYPTYPVYQPTAAPTAVPQNPYYPPVATAIPVVTQQPTVSDPNNGQSGLYGQTGYSSQPVESTSVPGTVGDFPVFEQYNVADIILIQNALIQKGYQLQADGSFGPKTGAAVKLFQQANGLKVDGIVGKDTAKKLGITLSAPGTNYRYQANFASIQSSTNYIVYVSIRSCKLTIFHYNGIKWERLKTVPCAVGNEASGYYTPMGVYAIRTKTDYFDHYNASEGKSYRFYNPAFFAGEVAIHSVSYDSTTGVWGDNALGTKVTNGCVRVSLTESEWIRNNVPIGSAVVVDDRNYNP
ncbi:peptidoglycan-binding protein [Candidatus Saccharibacteria bacterium]|nr:peptidoglycan-binding protein [Candidatus Saccharibacteria bacterium]